MKIKSVQFVKGVVGDDEILHNHIPEIAFVGRSNVGKSSLINSLLNVREMARTGKKQGKTKEINFYLVNEKYYFADLPGYGFAQGGFDDREKIRAIILGYLKQKETKIQTVALVVDGKVGLTDFDIDMLEILHAEGHRAVVIFNKTDKLNQKEMSANMRAIVNEFPHLEVLPYSSKLNKGAGHVLERLTA